MSTDPQTLKLQKKECQLFPPPTDGISYSERWFYTHRSERHTVRYSIVLLSMCPSNFSYIIHPVIANKHKASENPESTRKRQL